MKSFVEKIQHWLNHRLRQLIWKRWKKFRTRYTMLKKYGIKHDDALKLAASRKGYWRASSNHIIRTAITKDRLKKWRLKDLSQRIPNGTYGGGVLCKGTSKMEVGPPIRAVADRLIKQPSAAVVKSYGSERLWKRP